MHFKTACALLALIGAPAKAQFVDISPVPANVRARITLANTLLGAAIGGTCAWIAHRSVSRGLVFGATGGVVTSAGRQIVATRGVAAGLSGRIIHDVGLGLGSAAKDSLLVLPVHVGPFVARWSPSTRRRPSIRVNLTNVIVSTAALVQAGSRIDWRSTLWSGAICVRPPMPLLGSDVDVRPRAGPGTIVLSPGSTLCEDTLRGEQVCRVDLAHEDIHVLQLDMMHEWVGRDLERAMLRKIRGGKTLERYAEIGALGFGGVAVFDLTRPYERRWTEYEASWLTEGSGPPKP